MLPFPLSSLTASRLSVGIFAAINIVVDIRVPAVIDIYVSATTMPITPAPRITPCCTKGYTASKSKACAPRVSRVGI
jgi:hypothetical protein